MKLFHGDIEVNKWYEEETLVLKSYYGDNLIYGEEEPAPPALNVCYDVTENIGTYTSTTYDEVYDKASSNWYMLNNLNQYEQYGVYADNKATYYDGKLVVVNSHEWKYTNGAWVDLGEVSGGETRISLGNDSSSLEGTSFPTTFKIAKSQLCGEYASFTISFNGGAGSLSFNYNHYGDEAYLILDYYDYSLQIFVSIPYTEDEDYYYFAPDEYTEGVPDSVTIESVSASNDCQMPFDVIIESISYIEEYVAKDEPPYILAFNTMTEACSYTGCVYNGLYANIGGGIYIVSNGGWEAITPTTKNYLRFISKDSSGSTIGLSGTATPNVSYSFDGINWTTWDYSNITIPSGSTLYIKGNNPNGFNSENDNSVFTLVNSVEAHGNIMSLIYDDNFENELTIPSNDCFFRLFADCSGLTKAPELPATTLTQGCYGSMFFRCTSLTTAPTLPATILTYQCYSNMFSYCSGLTTPPQLPATTLAMECYNSMFWMCPSLTTAPQLPATTLVQSCYYGMFYGCSSLTAAPQLPATTLAQYCYRSMFYKCTSLTQAPQLSATTLADYCYQEMFRGCTSLTQAPQLPATTLRNSCYYNMFAGCTSLTTAPTLPAETLVSACYRTMFSGCTSLNYIKMMATDISASNCLYNWVSGVAASGTFVKNANATWTTTGASGVPTGWTVETASS